MYGKIINGNLKNAPKVIKQGDKQIINPSAEKLAEAGYLPVEYADPPEVEEGYVSVSSWEEQDGKIIQNWTIAKEGEEE